MNYYTDVLKKYAVFSGRARRKEYWMFFLWNIIIGFVLGFVLTLISAGIKNQAPIFLMYLYCLAILLPSLGVFVRRMHDINRSGWWFFISLIPFIGAIVLIVFEAMDGTPGDNKYGPNPKGVAAASQGPVQ